MTNNTPNIPIVIGAIGVGTTTTTVEIVNLDTLLMYKTKEVKERLSTFKDLSEIDYISKSGKELRRERRKQQRKKIVLK